MTRDEQKLNKELRKRLPQEIRKLNKKYKIQYAHEFLYRFEGDFLYIGMPSISSVECGKLRNSVEIKPWVLDEIYWRTQKMDMDEMLKQPMSLHVRGAFTVGNIYFKELSVYEHTTNDNLSERVEQMLIEFDKFIDTHKKVLTSVNCLINDIDGYTVSDLNKSLVYMRQDEYEKGLLALKNGEKEETIIHVDSNGKTAKEYVIEECFNEKRDASLFKKQEVYTLRKFWGTCNNSNYLVGCNGSTIYVYDKNEKEVAKFKDANYVYRAKFIPNTNILIAKSTAGFLVIYNLDELKLVKKIKVSLIGAQDEGFIITPDRKYLYNIEKPLYSTKTQLTIYDTLNFEVVKTLFKNNDKVVLKNLEFDEKSEICYVLGFVRDDTGVYDYGFIGKLLDDKIIEIKKIDEKRYDYISAYKSWEDKGFTDKALEWSRLKLEEKIEKISLTEIYKMLDNQNKTKKKSIIQKLFGK